MEKFDDFLDMLPNTRETSFYMWGTGNTAQMYHEGIAREEGITIEGYIDNNPEKWERMFLGKQVLSPRKYHGNSDGPVLICTAQNAVLHAVREQISLGGGTGYSVDEWIFSRHKEELREVYKSLEDDESKEIFLQVLLHRLTWEPLQEKYVSEQQYFAVKDFRVRRNDDVFIDCGAFVGDTVERYIWQMDGIFHQIMAFEPDPKNCRALEKRIGRLREEWNIPVGNIEIYPYGIGEREDDVVIGRYEDNRGLGSRIRTTDEKRCDDIVVRMVSLDGFFAGRSDRATFIKADIESYEYKMLLGAEQVIRNHRPRMAVCIYHNPTDMWSIPLLLKKFNPDYKFAIRHHSYSLDETVLYAYM